MAQIQLDELIDHLSAEVKRAIRDAFTEVAPHARVDEEAFYQSLKKNIRRCCHLWENVPDKYVKNG